MLKILFISANPRDTDKPLSIEKERTAIENKIAQFKGRYEFKNWEGMRIEDLLTVVSEFKPNVLHFTGHASKEGVPVFLNRDDEGQLIPAEPFVCALSLFKDNIECVILNACFTTHLAEKIAEHIKCVIGSLGEVNDIKEGLTFSPYFYYRVLSLDRDSVSKAFKFAATQVELTGGRWEVFDIRCRKDVNSDNLYLVPLDTKSLPSEVVNKIIAFLICYAGIGNGTTILQVWQDDRCGSLRALLDLFQDNAKAYSLSELETAFIDDTILFFKTNIARAETERELFNQKLMECKKFFRRWVTDYDKHLAESTRYNYSSSGDDRVFTIVYGFYEVIDSMIDLRGAANPFVQNYRNKKFLRSLVTQNRQMCSSLEAKLNSLREDLTYQKASGHTIWNEHTWKEIISIQDDLVIQMSNLILHFTNVDQPGTNYAVLQIMETTRSELKRLWTKAIKNILYRGGLSTVA